MRGVSRRASRVAPLFAVFLIFTAVGAWAGETSSPPTDPPQIRLQPPVGVTTQARLNPPVGVTAQARMNPPVGVTARLGPPVGAPLFDLILFWLQSRLSVPHP